MFINKWIENQSGTGNGMSFSYKEKLSSNECVIQHG